LIKLSRATMVGNQKGGACLDEHRISDPNPHDIETGYYGWHRVREFTRVACYGSHEVKNSRESLVLPCMGEQRTVYTS
jgi:hypothetical protein